MLTQKRLKELMHYNPDTGIFTRLKRTAMRQKVGEIVGVKCKKGYLKCGIDNKEYTLHRLAFLYMTDKFPKGHVDHIDQDKTNNSWNNLREVTGSENLKNMSKSKANKSGFTGVFWDKSKNRWVAHICVDRKHITKRFKNKEDAIKQRQEWNVIYKFHKNHGKDKL
jgi:hypothetical protein